MSGGALVAGIGNPDRGDDGFGPAVAGRLRGKIPAGTRILARNGDLLSLIEEWEGFATVVLVDAAAPLGRPGRIHRIDLIRERLPGGLARHSTHAFGITEAVGLARSLGRLPRHLVAYLVEGERFDIGAPLSPSVAAAVGPAAERILAELFRLSARSTEGAGHA
jgi:hydrogenase maturation protease